METDKKSQAFMAGAIVVAVLALITIYFLVRSRAPRTNKVTEITAGLPESFPANVPIEDGAKITHKYNAISPEGVTQATVQFESKKNVAENFYLYRNFFSARGSGWAVSNEDFTPANPRQAAFFAKSAGGIMSVNISRGHNISSSLVDLSFVGTKK